jgi:outer membrane lipoprotein SlyB
MKKIVSAIAFSVSLMLLGAGCADKALPQSRVGSISQSYTGVVTMVEPVQVHGDGTVTSMLGMVAGGILGHQFGGGEGKDLLTMGGAMAGAVAGANADIRQAQRITIQFDSGKTITTVLPIDANNPYRYHKGDRVTVYITNGKVTEIR